MWSTFTLDTFGDRPLFMPLARTFGQSDTACISVEMSFIDEYEFFRRVWCDVRVDGGTTEQHMHCNELLDRWNEIVHPSSSAIYVIW